MSRLSAAVCFIILMLVGCERKERAAMLIKPNMQTICIGRHLIDIPSDFRAMLPVSGIFRPLGKKRSSIDVSVIANGITPASFGEALGKRRGEILASTRGETKVLKEEIQKAENSRLFRILQIDDAYTSELHMMKRDLYVRARADSYENHFHEVEKELFDFSDELVEAAGPGDRRTGFCVGDALILGGYDTESMTMSFRSDESPDILITVAVDMFGQDEPKTLLQRVNGPESLLERFNAQHKVLRQGELQVAGMQAEEWLGSIDLGENRDKKQYGFALETRRVVPKPQLPRLKLTLDSGQHDRNGVQQPNSLTAEKAIALWEMITSSIRLRSTTAQ